MRLLAPLYARAAAWRRAWYARHPEARRRLARPVISVGNIAVGGSGKTPVVAALARQLCGAGERPSVLSRGYRRARRVDGVVVVSDGERVLEAVDRSGDEPLMLARSLSGVPVLAGGDRYLAGTIAERRFGSTVHLLDDGFQHFALHRDVDLVIVSPRDLHDDVLPAGRLRESIDSAAAADAVLVPGSEADLAAIDAHVGAARAFRVVAEYGEPRLVEPFGDPVPRSERRRALVVAGIARPERFFDAVRSLGWDVAEEMAFRDHHRFTTRDLRRIVTAADSRDVDVILTTEKDAMRLQALSLGPLRRGCAYLPMTVSIEPAATFDVWLRSRLAR